MNFKALSCSINFIFNPNQVIIMPLNLGMFPVAPMLLALLIPIIYSLMHKRREMQSTRTLSEAKIYIPPVRLYLI